MVDEGSLPLRAVETKALDLDALLFLREPSGVLGVVGHTEEYHNTQDDCKNQSQRSFGVDLW
jgi:hypothetical protein